MKKSPEVHQFQLSVVADLPPSSSMCLVTFKELTNSFSRYKSQDCHPTGDYCTKNI
jgi:hypothetical protein